MLIRGVPTGYVPVTPEVSGSSGTSLSAAASMSVLLASLGDQYGFRPELRGEIVQDILPVRGLETQQISLGSTAELTAHIETAFSRFRSDYVALLCVRQDHEGTAGTTLSSIDAILPFLDDAEKGVLRQPRFRTRVDPSFVIGDNLTEEVWVDPICVFSGSTRRPALRVDFSETQAKDAGASKALEALVDVEISARVIVYLRVGDLLIVDNHRALHGRTPFVPRYDGNDRWLLRSFVTKDLRRSEGFRPEDSRIVEPDYYYD